MSGNFWLLLNNFRRNFRSEEDLRKDWEELSAIFQIWIFLFVLPLGPEIFPGTRRILFLKPADYRCDTIYF